MPSSHEERAEARTCQGGVTGRTYAFFVSYFVLFFGLAYCSFGDSQRFESPESSPPALSPTHPTYARLHGAAKQRKQRNSTGRRKTMERPCPPRVGKYCQLLLFSLLLGAEPWARAAPPTLACCRRWARTPTESGGSLSLAPCRTASFPHGASPTRASRASRSLRRSSHRSIRT